MKNLKMAAKIGVGFGLVIAIMLALGGLVFLNMSGVQGDVRRLDKETVPQVAIANSMARAAEMTSSNILAFALTLDEKYSDRVMKYLGDMGKAVADAQALSTKNARLNVLRKNSAAADEKLKELNPIANDALTAEKAIFSARGSQQVAATTLEKMSSNFLALQNKKLADAIRRRAGFSEISRRVAAVNGMNDIIAIEDDLALAVYKSATLNDPSILQGAIDGFASFDEKAAALIQASDEEDKARLPRPCRRHEEDGDAPGLG
jgi:methyl-accepting chemotaxis protein